MSDCDALSEAKWVRTGATVKPTLAPLSLVSTGDFVGLMPQQIAEHPLAKQFLSMVPVAEGGLDLQVAAIVRRVSTVLPAVRHCIAHLRRAAHHHAKDG